MDDATPFAKTETSLDAAIASMDAHGGFAVLRYKGREIIMMTEAKFETWEDAVDNARIEQSIADADPYRISLEDLRAKYDIPKPGA